MRLLLAFSLICILTGCHHYKSDSRNGVRVLPDTTIDEDTHFFPVTSYIKGQMFEIRDKGVNPLKYTTVQGHTDSVWLKLTDLEPAMHEFLTPVIDTANMSKLFKETRFLDQSINAYSFTYEPFKQLPDSITIRHWDVYIDPETNKVKRVYIIKELPGNKILQLTWVGGKWCKIVTIATHAGGITSIEKEERIIWDF